MSRFVFQFVGLMLLMVALAYWKRHAGTKSPPIRNGFKVVRWPLAIRLINAAFFIIMLALCLFLLWTSLATEEKVPLILWALAIPLLVLSAYGALACALVTNTTKRPSLPTR